MEEEEEEEEEEFGGLIDVKQVLRMKRGHYAGRRQKSIKYRYSTLTSPPLQAKGRLEKGLDGRVSIERRDLREGGARADWAMRSRVGWSGGVLVLRLQWLVERWVERWVETLVERYVERFERLVSRFRWLVWWLVERLVQRLECWFCGWFGGGPH